MDSVEFLRPFLVLLAGRRQFGLDLLPWLGDVPPDLLIGPDAIQKSPDVGLREVRHGLDGHSHSSWRQVWACRQAPACRPP
jgi:hypothetical protein